jgi:tRNA(fMet)-specific endonuclease VapC
MKAHPLALAYRPLLAGHDLAISFMTVAELYDGAVWAGWGPKKRQLLDDVIREYVVIPSSLEVCRRWGEVRFARRAQPISSEDAWIAACAVARNCELVTHNPSDFGGVPQLRIRTAAVHP